MARRPPNPEPPEILKGVPANVDIHDFDAKDSPMLDWGEPSGESFTYSVNHTRRPIKTEAERAQGPKTRARNHEIVSGRPFQR